MDRVDPKLGPLLALVALSEAAEGQLGNSPGVNDVGPPPATEAAQAPAPAPPPHAGQELTSLDVKDVDVVDLLLGLAAKRGKNIVIGDDVKGTLSITFRDVPWETALETVLESRSLQKIEKENVIRIVSTEQLVRERAIAARLQEVKADAEAVAAAERARQEALARGPVREETIRLYYADPVEVSTTLQGILGIPSQEVQFRSRGGIAPGPFESHEWHYCPRARAYYPSISQCPGGWLTVPRP